MKSCIIRIATLCAMQTMYSDLQLGFRTFQL